MNIAQCDAVRRARILMSEISENFTAQYSDFDKACCDKWLVYWSTDGTPHVLEESSAGTGFFDADGQWFLPYMRHSDRGHWLEQCGMYCYGNRYKCNDSPEEAIEFIKAAGIHKFQHAGFCAHVPKSLLYPGAANDFIHMDQANSQEKPRPIIRVRNKRKYPELAAANRVIAGMRTKGVLEALDSRVLQCQWLLDTGSGHDLIDENKMSKFPTAIRKAKRKMRFDTAGGKTTASQEACLRISEMNDIEASPLILESTPPVLSVGRRVEEEGFSFHWHKPGVPYMVHPDQAAVTIATVEGNIPIVDSESTTLVLDNNERIMGFADTIGAHVCQCTNDGPTLCVPLLSLPQHVVPAKPQSLAHAIEKDDVLNPIGGSAKGGTDSTPSIQNSVQGVSKTSMKSTLLGRLGPHYHHELLVIPKHLLGLLRNWATAAMMQQTHWHQVWFTKVRKIQNPKRTSFQVGGIRTMTCSCMPSSLW